jgi:hypothetical protein
MGKQAQEWADSVDNGHKFLVTHPLSPASLTNQKMGY